MSLAQFSVEGEDFIGLLGFATDKYCVCSPKFPDFDLLDVPLIKTAVYGTHLCGMFLAGNSKGLIAPYFTGEKEMKILTDALSPLGVEVSTIEGKHTSLGVLVAANDKVAVVSPLIEDVGQIQDILDVEVVVMDLEGHMEAGSCISATNKGFLAHPDCHVILNQLNDIFDVTGGVGTVNYGVSYPGTGIIANSNGAITGSRTTGIEMGRIDKSLGFL